MTYEEQSQAAGRHIFPDLVRAFALFGIVMVNVAYFAYPGELTYFYGGLNSTADLAASYSVDAIFLMKSYTLFSFMFGAGLAYQMIAAERRGASFAPRYFRRMLGLIILGILHVTLAFVGDILIMYALFGSLLFLFRNRPVKSLIRWASSFLLIQILISIMFGVGLTLGETFDPDSMVQMQTMMREGMDAGTVIYQNGSFTDIAARRWSEWIGYALFAAPLQGGGILSFFLFGLAAVRAGIMTDPSAPIWRRARRIYLPIGFVISLIGAWMVHHGGGAMTGFGSFGMTVILIGAPLASLGYMGWIARWSVGPVTGLRLFLARAGTSTLSAYLLQSLLLSLVFCAYGLGLYAKVGAAGCVAIAALVGIITLSFSSLWRAKFARGPVEALLRRWTYGTTGC